VNVNVSKYSKTIQASLFQTIILHVNQTTLLSLQ